MMAAKTTTTTTTKKTTMTTTTTTRKTHDVRPQERIRKLKSSRRLRRRTMATKIHYSTMAISSNSLSS